MSLALLFPLNDGPPKPTVEERLAELETRVSELEDKDKLDK